MALIPKSGPMFRPDIKAGKIGVARLLDKVVSRLVKTAAMSVGMESADVVAHSLRSGLVTDAFAARVPEVVVMDQTGHRSTEVLRGYRREADQFKHNPAGQDGLCPPSPARKEFKPLERLVERL